MKKLFFLLVILFLQTNFAQDKHKFYDVNGSEISQEKFENQYNRLNNFILDYNRPDYKEHRLVRYRTEEQLESDEISRVYRYIESVTGKDLDPGKNVLISYLSSTNSVIDGDSKWDIFNQRYNEIILERGDVTRLWIHSPDLENLEPFQIKDIVWFEDENRMLEKQFFPEDVPYGGFLILQPDGSAYIQLNEYSNKDITDNIERLLGKK